MDDIKKNIAKNIAALRQRAGLKQSDLAQRLNYSDKAVSKWERAESVPDITVLKSIADMFDVTLDYLTEKHFGENEYPVEAHTRHRLRLVISLVSAAAVWLVATFIFVFGEMVGIANFERTWLIYILAVPVSVLVLFIFSCIWGKPIHMSISLSVFIWSLITFFFLLFYSESAWLLFILGAPVQVIILLLSSLDKRRRRKNSGASHR